MWPTEKVSDARAFARCRATMETAINRCRDMGASFWGGSGGIARFRPHPFTPGEELGVRLGAAVVQKEPREWGHGGAENSRSMGVHHGEHGEHGGEFG